MKTGRDIWEQALRLLRYTNGYGELDGQLEASLYKRGLAVVNQIYADLWFVAYPGDKGPHPLYSLDQEICLPEQLRDDGMAYGVAMLLAQGENDGENQAFFAGVYNQKRRCGACGRRIDVLPSIDVVG